MFQRSCVIFFNKVTKLLGKCTNIAIYIYLYTEYIHNAISFLICYFQQVAVDFKSFYHIKIHANSILQTHTKLLA